MWMGVRVGRRMGVGMGLWVGIGVQVGMGIGVRMGLWVGLRVGMGLWVGGVGLWVGRGRGLEWGCRLLGVGLWGGRTMWVGMGLWDEVGAPLPPPNPSPSWGARSSSTVVAPPRTRRRCWGVPAHNARAVVGGTP